MVHRQLPICKQVYLLIFSLCLISILSVKKVILYQKKLALSFLLYRLQIAPAFRALRDCSVDCPKFYFYKCSTSFYDTIRVIRTWVNWRNNVDMLCSTSFFPLLSMLTSNLDKSSKTHYKTTLEERKTEQCDPIWVHVLDCWSPGSFILSRLQKLLAFWLAERLLWLRKSTIT